MPKHYIAMAGLHGYLPNVCEAFCTQTDAVDYLASIHELGVRRRRKLAKNNYLELNMHGSHRPPVPADGNEYCEIQECECDDPVVHCDSDEFDSGE
jgi:hypothetical protein